jgi:tetratricopeptide (TPR) repeat protein
VRDPLNRARVLAAAAVLCVLWIALPVRLSQSSGGPSIAECSTLADTPAARRAGIIAALERCSALLPRDTELLADLGGEYEADGRPERAENIYRQAIAIDPGYADLRLRLGRLMLRRGDAGEAQQQAEAALRIQPNRKALIELLDEATQAGKRP